MTTEASVTELLMDFVTTAASNVMGNASLADVIDNMTSTTTSAPRAPTQAPPAPPLVSTETKDLVVEVCNCYLIPIVFVVGFFGNIMSFVVLLVHGLNNSTNVLLLGVTVSDWCYLVSMFTRKVSCIVGKFDYVTSRYLETGLLPTVYMINRIFGLTTPFLTMLITLERCLAVSIPFKVQKIVTPFRMKITVVCTYLLALAAIMPFFFIYEAKTYRDPVTGADLPRLAGTPFYYENYDAIVAYNNILLTGLFFYGPIVIVIVCTVFILTTIKRSAQWRKATAKGQDRGEERKMTQMLLTVAILYIILYIPGGIIGIVNTVVPDFGSLGGRYNNLFYLVAAIQLLLYVCNSSFNFIIYMLLSKKFYKTYLRIFLCRKEIGEDKKKTGLSRDLSTKTANLSITIDPSSISKDPPSIFANENE